VWRYSVDLLVSEGMPIPQHMDMWTQIRVQSRLSRQNNCKNSGGGNFSTSNVTVDVSEIKNCVI